jgi:hypothetical protein
VANIMAKKAKSKSQKTRKPSLEQTQKIPRVRKQRAYRHFRLSKRIKAQGKPLPGALRLCKQSLALIKRNKNVFIGLIIVNSLLSLVFVAGIGSIFDFVDNKEHVENLLGGQTSTLITSLALIGSLGVAAGTQAQEVSGAYQMFLVLITSLASIWAVRQIMAGNRVTSKEAYYKGLYPLVPFILVLLVIFLQLLPSLIGATLYSIVISNSIAITAIEKGVWLLLFIVLSLLTLYLIASSAFALLIVTLPDMTPMQALRSARQLVLHRRINVMLRLLALPILLIAVGLIILAPVVLLVPWGAVVLFLLFVSFCICFGNVYLYNLYRSLL